jgi:hypothetical protein
VTPSASENSWLTKYPLAENASDGSSRVMPFSSSRPAPASIVSWASLVESGSASGPLASVLSWSTMPAAYSGAICTASGISLR